MNPLSSNVKVFPTAFRKNVTVDGVTTTFNPESHLNTEQNLTTLSSRISESAKKSYVVSFSASAENGLAVFVINGYWFKVSDIYSLYTAGEELWAKIRLVNSAPSGQSEFVNPTLASATGTGTALDNLDAVSEGASYFLGLDFTDTEPTVDNVSTFCLQILDDEGNVPASSYLNISTTQVQNGSGSNKPISEEFTTDKINLNKNLIISDEYKIGPGNTMTDVVKYYINSDMWAAEGCYESENNDSFSKRSVFAYTPTNNLQFAYFTDLGEEGLTLDVAFSDTSVSGSDSLVDYLNGGNTRIEAVNIFRVQYDFTTDKATTYLNSNLSINGNILSDLNIDGELFIKVGTSYVDVLENMGVSIASTSDDTIKLKNIYGQLIGDSIQINNVQKANQANVAYGLTEYPNVFNLNVVQENIPAGGLYKTICTLPTDGTHITLCIVNVYFENQKNSQVPGWALPGRHQTFVIPAEAINFDSGRYYGDYHFYLQDSAGSKTGTTSITVNDVGLEWVAFRLSLSPIEPGSPRLKLVLCVDEQSHIRNAKIADIVIYTNSSTILS